MHNSDMIRCVPFSYLLLLVKALTILDKVPRDPLRVRATHIVDDSFTSHFCQLENNAGVRRPPLEKGIGPAHPSSVLPGFGSKLPLPLYADVRLHMPMIAYIAEGTHRHHYPAWWAEDRSGAHH